MKLGRIPLPVSRCQRELRYQQQSTGDIAERTIHAARSVGKDAVAEQPLQHPLRLRLAVARLHRHQRQQAGADAPHRFVADVDMRCAHALDQGQHATVLASFPRS